MFISWTFNIQPATGPGSNYSAETPSSLNDIGTRFCSGIKVGFFRIPKVKDIILRWAQ
jgi:hypothetical protein